jgi:hypothetical protein
VHTTDLTDGTNTATVANLKLAVDAKHARQHDLTSTDDHTGLTLTVNVSSTDAQVATAKAVWTAIAGITGGLTVQGAWNASTNTPTLTSGAGTNGDIYIVSVAGTTNLDGVTDWQIGDMAVFTGTWIKIDQTLSLAGVYSAMKSIISAGDGITLTWDDGATTLTIAGTPLLYPGPVDDIQNAPPLSPTAGYRWIVNDGAAPPYDDYLGYILERNAENTDWILTPGLPGMVCTVGTGGLYWTGNGVDWEEITAPDLTLYALLAGRAGGQTLYGGTAASENLQLHSTAHGTKGYIYLGNGLSYDGVNFRVGIGDAQFVPTQTFEVRGVVANITSGDFLVDTTSTAPGVTVGRTLSTGGTSTTFNVRNRLTNLRFHVPASSSSSIHITRFDQGGGLKIGSEIQASGFNLVNGGAMLEVAAPAAAAGAANLKTTGSSTTVTSSAAFGNVRVGSMLVANGLTRWVTAIASTSSLTVDTAVDWDNGGTGYAFTYTNPLIKAIDNATTRFLMNCLGYAGLGITTGIIPARLSLVAGTTAADGIAFGTDTTLYRSAADALKTDDQFFAALGVNTPKLTNLTTDGLVKVTASDGTLGTIAPDADTTKFLAYDLTWRTPAGGSASSPFDERVQFIPLEAEKHSLTPYTWQAPYVATGTSTGPYSCAFGGGMIAVVCQANSTLKLINMHTGAITQSVSIAQTGYIGHFVTWDGVDSFWITMIKDDYSYDNGYIKKVLAASPYTLTSLNLGANNSPQGIRCVGDVVHVPIYNSANHKLISRTAVTVSSTATPYATGPTSQGELVYDGTNLVVPDGTSLRLVHPTTGADNGSYAISSAAYLGVFDGGHSWWTSSTNILKVSHPDGVLVKTIAAGSGPLGLAYPGGGTLFFTSNAGTAISTLDMVNDSVPFSMGATANAPYFCCTNHSEAFWCDNTGNRLWRVPMGRG